MPRDLPFVRPSPPLLLVDLAIFGVFCTFAVAWVASVRATTRNRAAVVVHAAFAVYLVILACVVFLPLHGVRAAAASFEGTEPLSRAWRWGLQIHSPLVAGHVVVQRLANVALTIPFGFGVALIAPRLGLRRLFAVCVTAAVLIELAQLDVSVLVGFVYRTFDINDIIDNTLGASIGLALYVACASAVRSSGFGAGLPDGTLPGFIAHSATDFFTGREERRRSRSDATG